MDHKSDEVRPRILIVEDDEALANLVRSHLERAGYDVHVEHRGKPALVFAAEHRADLVILDLVLPDLSGYEVCLELRRLYHPWILPVMMLTALSQPKDKLLGFSHGAEAYLMKPVATSELLSTVEGMLSRVGRGS
jgi:two-component system, OmpR family, phosphate regulon response regulator PhoB